MINARTVDAELQKRYQQLALGHRPWRCPDMGMKYDKGVDGKLQSMSSSPSRRALGR